MLYVMTSESLKMKALAAIMLLVFIKFSLGIPNSLATSPNKIITSPSLLYVNLQCMWVFQFYYQI